MENSSSGKTSMQFVYFDAKADKKIVSNNRKTSSFGRDRAIIFRIWADQLSMKILQ